MDAKDLNEQAQSLFGKRASLMSLWQEQAENFYPERADFTYHRSLGVDFASNLMTSFPLLCRRDLGDQMGSMLRPTAKEWFHTGLIDPIRETNEAKRWMQWADSVMRRAMYDRKSMFTRAAKEGDHDWATFGQNVISVRLNSNRDALLYRCWHLRDCAWQEDENGQVSMMFRKWKPTARQLKTIFGDKVHTQVDQLLLQNKPFEEIECMHMVVDMDLYTGPVDTYDRGSDGNETKVRGPVKAAARKKFPYVSIYWDVTHSDLIEAMATHSKEYNVARWQTVSGSQYAFSPATIAALPDARLIQAMTYTILEAGEKATNPPMIATEDVVRSDIGVFAGAVTWVDRDYDERLGEALRPIAQDLRGMPIGRDMLGDSRQMLSAAFYLNKLKPFVPSTDPTMTAFQAGQIVAQYIRDALPLFEPMEIEYNGGICDLTFDELRRGGAFGSPLDMPKELAGSEVQFRFESPLHDAIEQQKGQKFLEMKAMIAQAVEMDQSVLAMPDWQTALRDALNGSQVPAKWIRDEITVKQMQDAAQASQQAQQAIEAMQGGADVAQKLASAQKDRAASMAPA
jgi:hypothetical protein